MSQLFNQSFNHLISESIKYLYKDHTVTQMNVVFNFLGGYYTKMEKNLNITEKTRKLNILLLR